MIIALTKTNEYIQAGDNKAQLLKNLICPSCGKRVFLKKGESKIPHFSHHPKEACKVFTEGETREHLEGKLALYNFFREKGYKVKLEAYLKNLKQRPDILIESKKKIVIEYQCSPIPIEKVIERTNSYKASGYKVIWILGNNLKPGPRITDLQKSFIEYIQYFPLYNALFRKKSKSSDIKSYPEVLW